jgi:hypothetical protein
MVLKNTPGNGTSGLKSRTGFTGRCIAVKNRVRNPTRVPSGRKGALALLAAVGIIGLLAVVVIPTQESSAHSDNTLSNGACSNCHPSTASTFLSISNLPTSTYNPGQAYTLTISVANANGLAGRNAFDLTVSAGTLSSTDSNVAVLTNNTEAHTSATGDTVSSWTVVWTAPLSGSVKVETWGVDGGGSRTSSEWNQDVRSLSTTAIPEFPTLLLPLVGIAGVLLVVSRISKKGSQ